MARSVGSRRGVLGQRRQRGDDVFVEGVPDLGAIEADAKDAPIVRWTVAAGDGEDGHDRRPYMRNTPNFGSGTGALHAAERPSASACRVSRRIEDPVVPQPGRRVVGRAFALVLLQDGLANGLLVVGGQRLPVARELVPLDRRQHAGGLLAAHDRDARVGPHPQQPRLVGAPAHAVVAGAERPADDHGELRHDRVGDGVDHLRAVLGDAGALVLASDDEAGDVLQEDERDAAEVAELDEVRRLERRLREEHAVVGDDADQEAVEPGEAGDERRAVALLELVEARAVDQPREDLADLVRLAACRR